MAELKPYPEYRDSGLPWLGKIPPHWKVERLKSLMSNIIMQTTKHKTNDFYIALENVESWTGRLRKTGFDVPSDSQVKQFRSGDILFGRLRPYLAKVTRPMMDGVCVGEFLVLRPRVSSATSSYMEQLLRSYTIIEAINSSTFGAKMPRADWQFIGGMAVTLPPLPEQAEIVRSLDHMDRRIRRYIRAKQKLIRLLEEQKQAIIHRAVTRGLDPSVPLKPSGVEWLGDVPEHWSIVSAKQVSRIFIPQRDKPKLNEEIGLQWITPECIGFRNAILSGNLVSPHAAKEAGCRSVPSGSVIASCIGRFGISSINQDPVYINQQLQAYIPTSAIDARYLRYIIKISKSYFEMNGNSTTLAYVNRQGFSDLPLILPPISIQETIVSSLERFESLLDLIIQRTNNQISLLREYRARLISDVVTGKLDVRGVNLPAAEDIEAPEEYTDFLESEEIIEEDLQEEIPAEGDLDEQ